MEKLQFDNDKFCLYAPDSLNYITGDMQTLLEEKMNFYKKLFDVSEFRKVQINYFDDNEKFREFIYSLRNNNSLPEYAVGTFDRGMINAYIPPNIIPGTPLYYAKKCLPAHELFHAMYKELILENNDLERVVWFDEGMAKLFSGENDTLLSDQKKFNIWLDKIIENTKEFPDLNYLKHGTSFVNERYNGYSLSLLAVKYLYDCLGYDEFKLLMGNIDGIKSYGENVVGDAISYYKCLVR